MMEGLKGPLAIFQKKCSYFDTQTPSWVNFKNIKKNI